MAKKLIFTTTATTAAKQQAIDGMLDVTFDMTKTSQSVDIALASAERTIEQSLINALHLPVGGNVLFPEKGAPLVNMLFNAGATVSEQRSTLMAFFAANEPRITVKELNLEFINTEFNERAVVISMSYSFMSASNINNVIVTVMNSGK